MNRSVVFACLLVLPLLAGAQNLIPNPGFEQCLEVPCGSMHGSLSQYVKNWENAGGGTADILSTEAAESCYASTNSNHWDSYGHEPPHGGKCMGMIMTSGHLGAYREYLGVTLTRPLVKGKKYYAEFYVSLADYSGLATNNMGMLFRTGEFQTVTDNIILGTPQVNTVTVIDKTVGWYKVSGTFVAADDYTYVLIGNFLPKESTSVKVMPVAESYVQPHTYRDGIAAYFVDDFMLKESSSHLTVGGDTLVDVGTTATLTADGGNTYSWADAERPDVIIGGGDELKVTMNKKRSFYVYSGGDTAFITVNIKRKESSYLAELNGRKVRKGRTVEVTGNEVTIEVFDKNDVDGDSVSLYYGDSLIVEHLAITHRKESFTIKIDPAHPKQIILFAENQGKVPPNTACIIIRDGRSSTEVILQSDFKYCDSVMLTHAQ